jgi:hypothetical protein
MNYAFIGIVLSVFFSWLHPFHISLSEVEFKPVKGTVELSHKIFIDDLEDAIEKAYQVKTYLDTPKESSEAGHLIKKYVEERFRLMADGKEVTFRFLGYEYEKDAVWIYREGQYSGSPGKVRIRNSILLELFADQVNFIHVKQGDARRSDRTRPGHEVSDFNF